MVRTRFAPSPTGLLHMGGVRTALYAWAFARHNNGKFILRIENTDRERSTDAATQVILESLEWLGLNYDEGPYYQMKRLDRYKAVIDTLLGNGLAYYCYMSLEELNTLREQQRRHNEKPRYNGHWRPENAAKLNLKIQPGTQPVIRFRNPDSGVVQWRDLIKGNISFNNEELDDFVIARQDGTPTYNFCVVVDDWDMQITHVIRGDDHVNNTPKQINILRALGATVPQYAHLSTICSDDGQKLSKRSGAISVLQYRDEGYLPEAIINYLSRLGWSHGDDEIFSREQLIEWFDIDNVSGVPARFDPEKLLWINRHYLQHSVSSNIVGKVKEFISQLNVTIDDSIDINSLVDINKSRSGTIVELAENISMYYSPRKLEEKSLLLLKKEKTQDILRELKNKLSAISWEKETLDKLVRDISKEKQLKLSEVAIPLRLCLLGTQHSAPFDQVLVVLGKNIVLQRLDGYLSKD
ncbi:MULTISPECIES: glutamate--tRNA ligase [Candidatus Ichthyocystis]|nr:MULTISPECIES: glutamate--tRNA ligase [Ichthyocystis]